MAERAAAGRGCGARSSTSRPATGLHSYEVRTAETATCGRQIYQAFAAHQGWAIRKLDLRRRKLEDHFVEVVLRSEAPKLPRRGWRNQSFRFAGPRGFGSGPLPKPRGPAKRFNEDSHEYPDRPRDRGGGLSPFAAEAGLSEVRADVPTFARWVGGVGLMLVFFGTAVLIFNTLRPAALARADLRPVLRHLRPALPALPRRPRRRPADPPRSTAGSG